MAASPAVVAAEAAARAKAAEIAAPASSEQIASIADPDYALRLAKTVGDIYGDASTQLLQIVARRLANGIDVPGWAERKLLELVGLRDETTAVVDRIAVLGPEAIRASITQAAETAVRASVPQLGVDFASTNQAAVIALARAAVASSADDAAQLLASMHLQILRSTADIFRGVISETTGGAVTGAQTRLQVAQRSLNRFAQQGITGFVDNSGRNWEIQSYTEMATRTATTRSMVQGRLTTYQQNGRQFVIVSDAPQECNLCRPWEGQVLAISPGDIGHDAGDGKVARASVSQATSAGLFHPNCRHDLRPYIAGVTTASSDTSDPAGDAARQKQRYLERGVRQWTRVQAAAMDDDASASAGAHVAQWRGALKTHLAANPGLTPKPSRTRVVAAR